jgi:hypothetical protein
VVSVSPVNLEEPSKQLTCIRRNALPCSESTPCILQVKAMQDGLATDTTHSLAIHVVRASGREGGAAAYKGVEGGDGLGSTLNRKDSPDGNRGHQRIDSSDSRRTPLAKSQVRGDDFESVTQAGSGVPWPELGAVFREYQMGHGILVLTRTATCVGCR